MYMIEIITLLTIFMLLGLTTDFVVMRILTVILSYNCQCYWVNIVIIISDVDNLELEFEILQTS